MVKGTIANYPTYTLQYSFTLTVIDYCFSTVITSNPISDRIFDIDDEVPLVVVTLWWFQSINSCPTITYALVNFESKYLLQILLI
jgi:hypothetical protein